jgi:hypothetical protein
MQGTGRAAQRASVQPAAAGAAATRKCVLSVRRTPSDRYQMAGLEGFERVRCQRSPASRTYQFWACYMGFLTHSTTCKSHLSVPLAVRATTSHQTPL